MHNPLWDTLLVLPGGQDVLCLCNSRKCIITFTEVPRLHSVLHQFNSAHNFTPTSIRNFWINHFDTSYPSTAMSLPIPEIKGKCFLQ